MMPVPTACRLYALKRSLIERIRNERSLTNGASAAGARVHNLPDLPRDISDDGDFHYAVLGPKAASESGKPSAEARRFINETTAQDRPQSKPERYRLGCTISRRVGLGKGQN